jgi:sugar phosphate isomerase/epimerase
MLMTRRDLLKSVSLLAAAPLARPPAAVRSRMCLAYTSFAVRLLQGRDILKSTAAALPADAFLDLCVRFGAGGAQLDWSQIEARDADALARLRSRVDRDALALELSVPSSSLETPAAYADMVRVATALGVTRVRVALLYGRRYETFKTREEWDAWHSKWQQTLQSMRGTIEAHPILVGIENHKDFHAQELVALLQALDTPRIGACVDFGNNVALLESPLETMKALAPFAVTTHVKDMAVRRTDDGFELSEVPLGDGLLPLADMIAELRARRPDAPLCLEMITRDPLRVPYRTDGYWIAIDRPPGPALARFEQDVLGKAWTRDLPHISGRTPADQVADEDDNVRRSMAYAQSTLRL